MSPLVVFGVIAGYFGVLILISYFTSRGATSNTFFTGNRQSPWYLVAFGMIGASLSGVTFISIPGEVGNTAFSYFQLVLGYLLGYFIIYTILMPIYYKLNLISIYTYLERRFGFKSYKTGSVLFLLSQTIGASFRLFLVAGVLQIAFFDAYGIPFAVTVLVTIILIWIYTYKAGIKTIVWTDTLQTFFMILAVILSITIIANELNLSFAGVVETVKEHEYSKIFHWNWRSKQNFFKQFFSGAFIAVVMTGLDQNMMQKNLTCRSLRDAQKNMFWFSLILVPVNLLFLSLGVLLYVYANETALEFFTDSDGALHFMFERIQYNTDDLYPVLAINHFTIVAGIVFLLGIIAAAFSSADSALTALTTAFCVDFLNFKNKTEAEKKRTRLIVHIGFSLVMFLVIVIFRLINDDSVITAVFRVAGYTYGPLLGLFAFGLFTKLKVNDLIVPFIAIISPLLCYFLSMFSEELFNGYKFGFELLMVNGLLTFIGLLLISKGKAKDIPEIKK